MTLSLEKRGGAFTGIRMLLCENLLPPRDEAIAVAQEELTRISPRRPRRRRLFEESALGKSTFPILQECGVAYGPVSKSHIGLPTHAAGACVRPSRSIRMSAPCRLP